LVGSSTCSQSSPSKFLALSLRIFFDTLRNLQTEADHRGRSQTHHAVQAQLAPPPHSARTNSEVTTTPLSEIEPSPQLSPVAALRGVRWSEIHAKGWVGWCWTLNTTRSFLRLLPIESNTHVVSATKKGTRAQTTQRSHERDAHTHSSRSRRDSLSSRGVIPVLGSIKS
jgi:hypothetical protein